MSDLTAQRIVEMLDLQPHPEGGWYSETYRHDPGTGGRGASTAIYYLLEAGDRSAWHRVKDADEVWHWHAGAPLAMTLSPDGRTSTSHRLGPDLVSGQRPQLVVPAGHWQTAKSVGHWTLVGCTVAPAFQFESFEMAPPDWEPGQGPPDGPAT